MFKADDGPDVNIFLSETKDENGAIDLGDMKGINGNYAYELNKSVDYKKYHFVLVFCKKYKVLFGYAELK